MPRTTLTDLESGVYLDDYEVAAQADEVDAWSIRKRTLRGGPSEGIDVVTVDNGRLRFEVLPTRGMGVWRGACDDLPLGWQSPVRFPVHPRLVERSSRGGFGWLDGFNEWICRCGLASIGNPECDRDALDGEQTLTLHGRIANLPAHQVAVEVTDQGPRRLAVHGVVDEAALFASKLQIRSTIETEIGSAALTIIDETTNLGDVPTEFQLMYHVNFGPPLLEKGSELIAGAAAVAPYDELSAKHTDQWSTCQGPTNGYVEQCFFLSPLADTNGNATVILCNATRDRAVSLRFATDQLPCVTFWKHLSGLNDGYVVGIEPGTSFPNKRSVERAAGRVRQLSGGETYRTTLQIACLATREEVESAVDAVRNADA